MRGSSRSTPQQIVEGMEYHPEGYGEHDQLPIVYNDAYNISFYGLEKVHPFDAGKWGKVFAALRRAGLLTDSNFYKPHEATEEELLVVHPPTYINKLRWSAYVATVTEVPLVAMLPNCVVQRRVLRPFRYQTAGTVLAAQLALDHGWAIHLGGGFHHASANRGGGFCCYADITLAVRELRRRGKIKHVIVVDLDAHQGNGYERDFLGDQDVYIMDVYNRAIYPNDEHAKGAIRRKVELRPGTSDEAYLKLVDDHLQMSLAEFDADLIVYNAGTDVLSGDMLGHLNISEKVVAVLPPEMPRTKKPRPRQSSLLHGKALSPDQIKYLECMVRELECTLESSRLAMQEKTDRICRNVDLWYDRIIRTVPEEILKRPFREVWDTAVPITNMSATSSVSVASTSLPDGEVPLDPKPSTATTVRQRAILASAKAKKTASQRRSAISKKKASDEALGVPKSTKRARKASVRTPVLHTRTTTGVPIVTPKFDIRKRPASARPVRRGETLLSLSGSPVEAKTSGVPIHVHVNNGQVVKVTTRDKSLNELCKAIKTLCEKM